MSLYFLLFGDFLLQEPISAGALLLEGYQHHYNVWIIHLLFVIATVLDTACFYYLGVFFHKKFSHGKLVLYTKNKAEAFLKFAGKNGQRIALFVYGPIIFPISAFIAPWLEISFWDALVFLFLGDLVFWYGSEWLVVFGVKSFIPDPQWALYSVLIIFTLLAFGTKYFRKRP